MVSAKNVSKNYSGKEILSNVNFTIGKGLKIGLVGKNGCGKTTLFKLINGIEEPTSGNIQIQNEVFGYIPQEFSFEEELVGEYLEKALPDSSKFYKVEALAEQLKFHNFDPYQNLNSLSEGQKMKVKLIEVMFKEPTTLFIDEPTNHLDIEGIMWFEEYVQQLPINVVMISHDRSFLNHTVDEIWEIDKCQIFKFTGNYDFYKGEKLKLIDKWNQDYMLFLKRKEKLENLLEHSRKIGRGVSATKKRIEREVTNNTKDKYTNKKIKELNLKADVHSGKLMIRFSDVSKTYGEKPVFEGLNFELRGQEKVWLYGPNGAGKSTIIKMIMGEEFITSGELRIGDNIRIGHFSQVQTHLNSKNNLMEEFTEKTGCYFAQAYSYLNRFLFDKESLKTRVGQLSPGERARFAFAVFAYKDYDMLVLDEPDNHLDIETKEVLEKSLHEFKGTLLLVSHDRYFVEEIGVDQILNLRDGSLTGFTSF